MKLSMFNIVLLALFITLFSNCAYRHYLGFHGPSINLHPDIHSGFSRDTECLECHHPDKSGKGPQTSHFNFTGCLKCHADDMN